MNLELTPAQARVISRALDDFMDDDANDIEDLELAGRISFIIRENLTKKRSKK